MKRRQRRTSKPEAPAKEPKSEPSVSPNAHRSPADVGTRSSENPVADDPAAERGERIETGKRIARSGGDSGFVPGAMADEKKPRRGKKR